MPTSDSAHPDLESLLTQIEWLQRLAGQLIADPGRADDAAQEVWLAALQHPPARAEGPRPWLARVLRNALRERYRADSSRHERERSVARAEAAAPSIDAPSEPRARELSEIDLALHGHRRLVEAVLALDEAQRRIVVQRFWHDLTPMEIAARDGLPVATVKSRLRRALARLRERAVDEDGPANNDGQGARALLAFVWRGVPIDTIVTSQKWLVGALMTKKLVLTVVSLALLALAFRYVVTPARSPDLAELQPDAGGPAGLVSIDVDDTSSAPVHPIVARVEADVWDVDRVHDLHGVVVNPDGTPCVAALVRVLANQFDGPQALFTQSEGSTELARAVTDTRGRYRVPLARGRLYDVAVGAPGLGRALRSRCLAGERVDFVLQRGFDLSGRILVEGEPVPGATVTIGPATQYFAGPEFALEVLHSDAEGRFHCSALAPRSYRIGVECAGFVAPWPERLELVDRDLQHDVQLARGRVVHGRVTDASSGEPLVGITIEAGVTGTSARTTTDLRGEYRLDGVVVEPRPGSEGGNTLAVLASGPGYVSSHRLLEFLPATAAPETVDFQLARGVTVRGKLAAADGDLSSADPRVVTVTSTYAPSSMLRNARQSGRVEPGGAFEVRGLKPDLRPLDPGDTRMRVYGTQSALRLSADGYGDVVLVLPSIESSRAAFDVGEVVLHRAASVSGRVVDEAGAPLPDVYVVIEQAPRWPESVRLDARIVHPMISGGLAARSLGTDDLGRFHFGALAPGSAVVSAYRPGGQQRAESPIELRAGEELAEVVLTLVSGATISGRVQSADGDAVAGAQVLCHGPDGRGGSTTSGVDGTFVARGLDEGELELIVFVSEHEVGAREVMSQRIERVAVGSRDLVVTLPTAIEAKGVVLGHSGQPVVEATVHFQSAGYWRELDAVTDELGAFTVQLPAGQRFDVSITPPRSSAARGSAALPRQVATDYDPGSGTLVLHLAP